MEMSTFSQPTRQQILHARSALFASGQMFEVTEDCSDDELVEAVMERWSVGVDNGRWNSMGARPPHFVQVRHNIVSSWGADNFLPWFVS